MKEKKKLGLGGQILIGLVLGIVVGAIFWVAMGAEAAGACCTCVSCAFCSGFLCGRWW